MTDFCKENVFTIFSTLVTYAKQKKITTYSEIASIINKNPRSMKYLLSYIGLFVESLKLDIPPITSLVCDKKSMVPRVGLKEFCPNYDYLSTDEINCLHQSVYNYPSWDIVLNKFQEAQTNSNYYIINTDKKSLKIAFPHKIWLEYGYAFTGGEIKPHGDQELGILHPGDRLFIYSNLEGIVAIGEVTEEWNRTVAQPPILYINENFTDSYKSKIEQKAQSGIIFGENKNYGEYRIEVNWLYDCSNSPVVHEEISHILKRNINLGSTLIHLKKDSKKAKDELWERCCRNGNKLMPRSFELQVEESLLLSNNKRQERLRLNANASNMPEKRPNNTSVFKRNPDVQAEVLIQANGKCQKCENDAPFKRKNGYPYLEIHHKKWLSQGGADIVANAVALCPNCHRQEHFGERFFWG